MVRCGLATQRVALSRIKDGRIATLTTKNGLPCDTIHWSIEDGDHALWLYTVCGLVRITRSELEAWIADPKHQIETTVWDAADGVRLSAASPATSVLPSRRQPMVNYGSIREMAFSSSILIMSLSTKFRRPYTSSGSWPTIRSTGKTCRTQPVSNLRLPARIRDLDDRLYCSQPRGAGKSSFQVSSSKGRTATGERSSTTAKCSTQICVRALPVSCHRR